MGKKIYGYSGILGVMIIFANLITFSAITPGYDSLWQTISELNTRGSENFLLMNIFYSLGFLLLGLYSVYYLTQAETSAKISGFLQITSLLLMLILNWFFPMNPELNIRTSQDLVHNNIITAAVLVFLLSQIFSIAYWAEKKQVLITRISISAFVAALLFGTLSLYSNIFKSELINIAERGWILTFLLYLFIVSVYLNRSLGAD